MITRRWSTVLLVIYWIATPIIALGALGLGLVMFSPGSGGLSSPLMSPFAIALAMMLLLAWRIWKHSSARRRAARARTAQAVAEVFGED